eukprot:SAG31_NODE_433_length_15750_cov_6.132579_4_plen_394_part_00
MTIAGLRQLQADDYLSVWVFSREDTNYALSQNSGGFHVAQVSSGLLTSGSDSDADVVAGGSVWTEEWGRPSGHDGDDAGYNHAGEYWGTCGTSRADRIQCCADECVRLAETCAKFAIWAHSTTEPPCCCHIISPDDAGTAMVINPTAQGPGNGWATWSRTQSHLHGGLHDITHQGSCTMATFQARADATNAACCADGDSCGSSGIPASCSLDCAELFVPFYDECRSIIEAVLPSAQLSGFETLAGQCLDIDPATMWTAINQLTAQGCVLREHAVTSSGGQPIVPSTGGHRRVQGLHFQVDSPDCPLDTFQQSIENVDSICCVQNDVNVCTGDIPSLCNLVCAAAFVPFFTACSALVTSLLGDEAPQVCHQTLRHKYCSMLLMHYCCVPYSFPH